MDDALYGKEDARGNWAPNKPVSYGPAFTWPPDPRALFKWFFGFPGYLLPWNVLYAVAAILIWTFLTPSLETMQTFSLSWAVLILIRNIGLGHRRLWRVAHVALCLAQAGHQLQVQQAMAESGLGGVPVQATRPGTTCSTRWSAACRSGRPTRCCCSGPTPTTSPR